MPTQRFLRQFILSRTSAAVPAGWRADTLDGWVLRWSEALPVSPLVDAGRGKIGWLLGWPIGERDDPASVPGAGDVEGFLSTLAGRFVAIVLSPDARRVYLDPGGQLGVVFNPSEEIVASSLLLARHEADPDPELIAALGIPARDAFFPFGLTPDRRVRRLLPNHFLDLRRFTVHRHWPRETEPPFGEATSITEAVLQIAARLTGTMSALATRNPLLVSLTAGRDTRMLLAACRANAPHLQFFTIAHPDAGGRLDVSVATALASRFSLSHRVFGWREATEEELIEWQSLTGQCVAGRTWKSVRTLGQLPSPGVCIQGLCAEVGRAFYWREGDVSCDSPTAEEITDRLGLPRHPRLVLAADSWLAGLSVRCRPDVLDLLYVEQRLGCWAGPSHYGHTRNPRVSPFSDRVLFRLMMDLPYDYRFRQRLAYDLVEGLWPELLRVPFNEEPGERGVWNRLRTRVRSRLSR